MNVSGLISQSVRPGVESRRATSASNCGARFQARPCFLAKASSTTQPRLWRVASYSRPGLPRPATSERDMTQRTFARPGRDEAAGRARKDAYFLAGAAGLAPAAGFAPAAGAAALAPAAGAAAAPAAGAAAPAAGAA